MKITASLIATIFLITPCSGQEDSIRILPAINLNGYIKQLSVFSFNKDFSENITDQFIHHRLNLKYEPNVHVRFTAEFRNRIFWGESVRTLPNFAEQLKNPNDQWNLQKAWINTSSIVAHTSIERLNLQYTQTKWNIRLGRQRINWGMATTWNPNDLFNAYNFLDFDFEERPGIDGARMHYQLSDLSDIQFVYTKIKGQKDIYAARYFFNKKNFDWQLISAWFKGRPAIGVGWAGNIGESGFRGEVQQYFEGGGEKAQLNVTTEIDRVFKKGWYANLGVLYNGNGLNRPLTNFNEANLNLSAENLMPARWNFITGIRKEIGSRWNSHYSVVYSPRMNLLIMIGSLRYELGKDLDMDLIGQSFFAELNSVFQSSRTTFFLRLKWSY